MDIVHAYADRIIERRMDEYRSDMAHALKIAGEAVRPGAKHTELGGAIRSGQTIKATKELWRITGMKMTDCKTAVDLVMGRL
ncbi:hypothetical protein [Rhodococcus qingshengii]|uniref:hypothetical protein n=1 Tax=Rhodococcus qingshengii TaxID=334542 RepID=UPI0035DD74D7